MFKTPAIPRTRVRPEATRNMSIPYTRPCMAVVRYISQTPILFSSSPTRESRRGSFPDQLRIPFAVRFSKVHFRHPAPDRVSEVNGPQLLQPGQSPLHFAGRQSQGNL